MNTLKPQILSASSISGDKIKNLQGEELGNIKDLMIDLGTGYVAYAVLSFGGFLGLGDKLFAVPMEALTLDAADKSFILNISKKKLEQAPGFDKDNWPDMTDLAWAGGIYSYYELKPYWE